VNVQKSFADGAERRTGALYLVATPIGNLEDMTWRAVRTLREADVIAAEDTRQTRKLLSHFQISGQLVSYHEHNKESSGKRAGAAHDGRTAGRPRERCGRAGRVRSRL